MHLKTDYILLAFIMVTSVMSSTADTSNSTSMTEEIDKVTSVPQGNQQESTTIPSETLAFIMVTSAMSSTGDTSNSTSMTEENVTSVPQENKQKSTTLSSSDALVNCSELNLSLLSKLLWDQTYPRSRNPEWLLEMSTDLYKRALPLIPCWIKSCWGKFEKARTTSVPEFIARNDLQRIDFYFISKFESGLSSTQSIKVMVSTISFFHKQCLNPQNEIMKNYTDKFKCLECTDDLITNYDDFLNTMSQLNTIDVFRRYVNPTILLVIFCTGILWDGTLILMFVRNKELRIVPNTMIINIAVCDMIRLVHMPIYYYYYDYNVEVLAYFMFNFAVLIMLSSVRVSSVLAMSIQRYLVISKSITSPSNNMFSNPRRYVIVSVLAVWLSSVVAVSLLFAISCMDENIFGIAIFISVVCITISVTIFNVLTAIKLRKSAKDIPGETAQSKLIRSRYRSSSLIISLTVLFWITDGLYLFSAPIFPLIQLQYSLYYNLAVYYLVCSAAFLNPLALFITSSKFRNMYKKHIFRWC